MIVQNKTNYSQDRTLQEEGFSKFAKENKDDSALKTNSSSGLKNIRSKKIVLLYPENLSKLILVPPYSLMYLATAARKAGFDPTIIDARVAKNPKKLLEKELSDAALLGVSVGMNYQVATGLIASRIAKDYGIPVIWGGSFSTFHSKRFIRFPFVDAIFLGGAEKNFYDFLSKGIEKTNGIIYKSQRAKSNKPFIFENNQYLHYDINEFFPPAWDLLNPDDYIRKYKDLHLMHVTTSRGCPHRCLYCYQPSMWKRRWSHLSIENVKKEIDYLTENSSMNGIYFFDDNFAVNRNRILTIGEYLKHKGIKWSALIRADYLNRDFVRDLKNKNCYKICVGAESGSQRILNFIQKDISVKDTISAAKALGENGLNSEFFFMIGFYGETDEDRKKTLSLINHIESIAHTETFLRVTVPFDGTEYCNLAYEKGFKRKMDLMSLSEEKWDFRPPYLPWLTKRKNEEIRRMVMVSMIRFVRKKSFKDLSLPKKFLYSILSPIADIRWKYQFWALPVDFGVYKLYVHLKNMKKTRQAESLIQDIKENRI